MALVALGQHRRPIRLSCDYIQCRICLPDDVNVLEWDWKCDFLRHIYQGAQNYYITNSEQISCSEHVMSSEINPKNIFHAV